MKKILVSTSSFGVESKLPIQKLEEAGFQLHFNPTGRKLTTDETVSLLDDVVGVVAGTEAYPRQVIEKAPSLRVISRCGAGVDGIDQACLKERNIALINTPNVHITAVAELALTGLLTVLRKIPQQHSLLARGTWEKKLGNNLSGKTVAIVGFGKVGKHFSKLLSGFQCKIIIYDPWLTDTVENGVEVVKDLADLWPLADVISLHVPATDQTRQMINERVLKACQKHVVLVNTSRGELVDETALYDFLQQHPTAGAYLDVFESEPYKGPLASLNNCITSPHIGTFTRETRLQMELEAATNLIDFFKHHG